MIAYGYDNDGVYTGPVRRQIDPLESKAAGEKIYLIPANSTATEPPEFDAAAQKAVWDGKAWRIENIPKPKPDSKAERILELKLLLSETDYQAVKYAEGWISEEDYAPIRAERQAWRNEINELEGE